MGILDDVAGSIFKGNGGNLMGDMFGYDTTLITYLDSVFSDNNPNSAVLKYFYQQLYRDFAPDINGYTLIFFVPPDLSGYRVNLRVNDGIPYDGSSVYSQEVESYMRTVGKIMTFAAIDFSPPQSQVRTDSISARTGRITMAAEVSESDTCSITFLDNRQLDIYMFHHIWVEYIREVLEGTIEPDSKYYISSDSYDDPRQGEDYAAIDYAASFYIVKYRPDMKTITFAAKCVGVFPQSLPNKELIGTRSSNEVVTLPFTYSCSGYREALYHEHAAGNSLWIFDELEKNILPNFQGASQSGLFGGFLGDVINGALGSTSSALKNLTGNAAKLGGIVGDVTKAASGAASVISGVAQSTGFSKIFTINK